MQILNVLWGCGGCYGFISNIGEELINKHTQSIVHSVGNKQHAYSLLECTTIVHISMCTYR